MLSLEKLREFSEVGKPFIILFSGKAGTGKTTAATIMRELIDSMGAVDFTIKSFASNVKKVAAASFGWDGEKDEKGRILLQDIGRIGRAYNDHIWASKTLAEIDSNPGLYDFVLIDDWRFPNELNFLKKTNRFFIKTVRIVAPSREILKGLPAYYDVSETSLPELLNDPVYDYVVYNNEDDGSLTTILRNVLESIILSQYNLYTKE